MTLFPMPRQRAAAAAAAPHYADDRVTVHLGDCRDVLRGLPDASIDAIVTDPPYELGFMGRTWDSSGVAYDTTVWAECLRVLKPGGHLLAFGGTRTWHRLVVAVEDAGFEIRDSITWLYASGFPKSLDVSKAIDKVRDDRGDIVKVTQWLKRKAWEAGHNRASVDAHMGTSDMAGWWLTDLRHRCQCPTWEQWERLRDLLGFDDAMDAEVWRLNGRKGEPGNDRPDRKVAEPGANVVFQPTQRVVNAGTPVLPAAQRWQGWGTALKPASEPVVVARKPLAGTVASNVLAYGTGALNIDGCRVATTDSLGGGAEKATTRDQKGDEGWIRPWMSDRAARDAHAQRVRDNVAKAESLGRWPANVVLTHAPECGPADEAPCVDGCPVADLDAQSGDRPSGSPVKGTEPSTSGGQGIYSEIGCVPYQGRNDGGGASRFFPTFRYEAKAPTSERPRADGVAHPTVKPVDLMRWLVRLVTPPDGTVLDPFAGSGTTGEAAAAEGLRAVLVELEAAHLPLITQRLTKRSDPVAHLASKGDDLGLLGELLDGAS